MKTVKGHKGIRKKSNGRYIVTKSIQGERYYAEFSTLREASNWKNQFHPLITPAPKCQRIQILSDSINGTNKSISFKDVVEQYESSFLKTLSSSTQYKKCQRMSKFLPNLFSLRMCEFTPQVIDRHLEDMKLLIDEKSKRCNFDKELKDLGSILEWYKEHRDFTYHSPLRKYHFKLGKIKEVPRKKKDLSMVQLDSLLNQLTEPFQSLVAIQFYLAARIGEAAALNVDTVDFVKRQITISDTILWGKSKPIHSTTTKTGETAVVQMNDEMFDRLKRLDTLRPSGCKFFFHRKGKPLRYNPILEKLNEALIRAGLPEFSGTNILRHSMATFSRKEVGLDATQAMLRHTTARMSETYAKLDVNDKVSTVIIRAEEQFKKAQESRLHVRATICDQDEKDLV